MSQKPRTISQKVQKGEFPYPTKWKLRRVADFRAEIHRSDDTWSYGYGNTKDDALKDARRRLDEGDVALYDY